MVVQRNFLFKFFLVAKIWRSLVLSGRRVGWIFKLINPFLFTLILRPFLLVMLLAGNL